jgi:hypothetical protein
MAETRLISAVDLAKRSSYQPPLIEAQVALGGWYADHNILDRAAIHIHRALEDASRDNLALHFIDARIALASLLRQQGSEVEASRTLKDARRDSELLGYYWGVENSSKIM